MFKVIYYQTERGDDPVYKFLESLDKKSRAKVMAHKEYDDIRTPKIRTFQEHLKDELKNPEFRKHFEEERRALALAIKIVSLRQKNGWTQKDFAKAMGTSQQAVSRIESGEYEGFTLKTLEKIAEATRTRLKIDFLPAAG